jgi:transposase
MEPLQPHKSEYWLFPKIDDWDAFVKRVALVCHFILIAIKGEDLNLHVLSVDEKTCIQAIERYESVAPLSKGGYKRKEFEYTRHGTTTLIAAINVGNGQLINAHLQATRDEKDFADFIKQTVNALPEMDKVVILSDQLNTHVSESLVRWIAESGGYSKEDLGIKGEKGILKNMKTRKAFLESEYHRVRFIYTPKHCSWLNPIENWFAKLQRHVIKNGNFLSVKELEGKIKSYIVFYNHRLAKALKWQFKGFSKAKVLFNIIVNDL